MRLAIVGAGSTRLPLMLASVAEAGSGTGAGAGAGTGAGSSLSEVVLFDVRPERIAALLPIAKALASECGPLPAISVAASADEAFEGVDAAIFTIRPGFEEARARDERACLEAGVLGQETTGAAGLAFATRSIPAVLAYCRLAESRSPGFLPVVFTNPAGMVAQALADEGFERAVGICDSATVAAKAIALRAGVAFENVTFEVHGLNHLSWTGRVTAAGRDLMPGAMQDESLLNELVPWWVRETPAMGRIPNEYLYYWYRTADAVAALKAEHQTRGEALVATNRNMLNDVGALCAAERVSDGLVRYAAYLSGRNSSYMEYARGEHVRGAAPSAMSPADAIAFLKTQTGGYAEVAMELLAGRTGTNPCRMALNVQNRGALPGLDEGDVVEVDCTVDGDGVRPNPHGALPPDDLKLMTRVKAYEHLAVKAIREGSQRLAIEALVAHPLVDHRQTAEHLAAVLAIDLGQAPARGRRAT